MSVELIAVCFKKQFENHADRDVMLALCDHANDEGICWPSRAHIAWKMDRHPETVKACLKKFRKQGLIETRREANNDLSKSPVLRVLPHKLPDKKPREGGGSQTPRGEGAADPPGRGAGDSPKSSLEPSVSSSNEEAAKPPRAGSSDEWVGDNATTPQKQSYFVGYLARRLKERGLDEKKPITGSYRKQFVGEVAAHLNKGYSRARILAGIDYVVFRWRVERVGLSVGIDRAEGQDNVRHLRPVPEPQEGGGLEKLSDKMARLGVTS